MHTISISLYGMDQKGTGCFIPNSLQERKGSLTGSKADRQPPLLKLEPAKKIELWVRVNIFLVLWGSGWDSSSKVVYYSTPTTPYGIDSGKVAKSSGRNLLNKCCSQRWSTFLAPHMQPFIRNLTKFRINEKRAVHTDANIVHIAGQDIELWWCHFIIILKYF